MNRDTIFRTFSALSQFFLLTRGDALRSAQRLPLAFIFRAFGAVQNEFRHLRQRNEPQITQIGSPVEEFSSFPIRLPGTIFFGSSFNNDVEILAQFLCVFGVIFKYCA